MATTLYPGIPFSPQATLTNNIGAADTIIEVSDVSAFPPAPNLATIGTDEEGETILYTAKTGTALSGCQRGVEGTARNWTVGELIGRNFTAKDHADLIAAVSEARDAATTAAGVATAAGSAAKAAQEAATAAEETASTAATDAAQAKKDAQTAADAAATAQGEAETAQTAASSASSAASTAQKEAGEAKKAAGEAVETATAAADIATAAAEMAATAATDAAQAKEDAQTAAEKSLEYALAADVGQSMAGQTVEPTKGTTVTAGDGAEIFNDYRTRTYNDGTPTAGNVASGTRSHAEGNATTASAYYAHAEGAATVASSTCAHAEGLGTQATNGSAHAEGSTTIASGNSSHAEGSGTRATGDYSHAEGAGTQALHQCTHAEGFYTKATAQYAHAEGYHAEASAVRSHAEGDYTVASGNASHAEGDRTVASNSSAHAEGSGTEASAIYTHAEGFHTRASGIYSHAEGFYTVASSSHTHAGGCGTLASGTTQTVIGEANVEKFSREYLIIGKGTFYGPGSTGTTTRANCFRVNGTGVYASGNYNSSGADYAELFEWADGNPEAQDRAGHFVTLEGETIRLAGPGDSYILGIVSGAPSVVGDVYDDQWQGMYLTDIFGRPLWENVEFPDVTETFPDPENPESTISRIIIPAHTERRQKLNPAYDNRQLPYIPRSERPEWDAVGMLGKLVAVDDGTCVPNGWAAVGEGGAATNSEERTKYRVMARLDERHVRILIL